MATVLSCSTCHYPITFRDPKPTPKVDWEHEVKCPRCGAQFSITVRMTQPALLHEKRVEEIKNRPSA